MSGPRKKFSKSSSFYRKTKREFFESNDALLKTALAQNAVYSSQPRRAACKLCGSRLPTETDFESHGVHYAFCAECGHVNGAFEDSRDFVERLYIEDSGAEYSKAYVDDDYVERAQSIYAPKLQFLREGLPPSLPLSVLDIGCGAGQFVYCCLKEGVPATGVDVGKRLVEFGNAEMARLVGAEPLRKVDEGGFLDAITESRATVLAAFGVIEHLREPNRLFDAFAKSPLQYLLFSVPMFSSSAIFEIAFDSVFPRQLSGGHTHLFTERSLAWLYRHRGWAPVAEWRFGTDMMDLYRSLLVVLEQKGASAKVIEDLDKGFGRHVDALQEILDAGEFCSEIHVLVRK
jgi:SAM-dependent methyltransferase